jgi:hypothetical protein
MISVDFSAPIVSKRPRISGEVKAENAHGQVKMIGRSVRFGHAKSGAAAEHT